MFRLWETLKNRPEQPPTLEELQMAANKISLDSKAAMDYIKNLDQKAGALVDGFARQAARAEVRNLVVY